MIDASLPRRLLILAGSAAKRDDPAPIPARDRYDGPLWRTLRTTDPRGRLARVGFLSARFGFRDAQTPIEDYDARLSEDLAARMIAGGMTTRWPRPPSPRRPDNYGMHLAPRLRRSRGMAPSRSTTSLSSAATSI